MQCNNSFLTVLILLQALDMKEHEIQWVTNHLGHTLDVHKIHYRQTSDTLERTQVAKLLLLQDHDKLGIFFNKNLSDIQMQGKVVLCKSSEQVHQNIGAKALVYIGCFSNICLPSTIINIPAVGQYSVVLGWCVALC